MASFTLLPHRALVAVTGQDRISFLQGLVSNDMRLMEAGQAVWAAFLTPQGKFLHEFFVVQHRDAVLLECEHARRDDLIVRLSRYKLRAKVQLAVEDRLDVGVAWGDQAASLLAISPAPGTVAARGEGVLYVDPRLPGAGVRFALPPGQTAGLGPTKTGLEDYRALIKKRLMPVTIDGATPPAGCALTRNGRDAGEMKSASGQAGLALVRLDAWDHPGGLTAGDAKVTPVKPDWMKLPQD
jgi:folate-binding Fe-S cluster repair protein YgfZ